MPVLSLNNHVLKLATLLDPSSSRSFRCGRLVNELRFSIFGNIVPCRRNIVYWWYLGVYILCKNILYFFKVFFFLLSFIKSQNFSLIKCSNLNKSFFSNYYQAMSILRWLLLWTPVWLTVSPRASCGWLVQQNSNFKHPKVKSNDLYIWSPTWLQRRKEKEKW